MRLLTLITLGAASVAANDAVDDIIRKLSEHNSSNETASEETTSPNTTVGNEGTTGAPENTTANNSTGNGEDTTPAGVSQNNDTTAPAATTSADNSTVETSAATTGSVETSAATTAATAETTAVTTAEATNGTTGNETATTTAPAPTKEVKATTEVTMTVPSEILTNVTKLNAFETAIGNAFGDVVCDLVSGTNKLYENVDACKCAPERVNNNKYTVNQDGTHKCQSEKKERRRRAQATRNLSAGTTFETSSEMTVDEAKVGDTKTDMTITKENLEPSMQTKVQTRISASADIATAAANVTQGLTATASVVTVLGENNNPTTTAGAVAAASTGFGLLIAALLF